MLADFVDGADVRVVDCRASLSLALEAFERLALLGDVFEKESQRDGTMEARALGPIVSKVVFLLHEPEGQSH